MNAATFLLLHQTVMRAIARPANLPPAAPAATAARPKWMDEPARRSQAETVADEFDSVSAMPAGEWSDEA